MNDNSGSSDSSNEEKTESSQDSGDAEMKRQDFGRGSGDGKILSQHVEA